MVNILYTIGYSGYKIEEFLNTIKSNNITATIDVRSTPYSQYHSEYNKEALESFLMANGIYYHNYAKEFGAQQKNRAFYSQGGYLDFDIFAKSDEFLSGVEKLRAGMDMGYSFVLMCAEKDPINCHRAIMVTREFYRLGFSIVHLLPNGGKQSQEELEARLLDRYFPNRNQLTLFENEESSYRELINRSYKKRNAEIGYTTED